MWAHARIIYENLKWHWFSSNNNNNSIQWNFDLNINKNTHQSFKHAPFFNMNSLPKKWYVITEKKEFIGIYLIGLLLLFWHTWIYYVNRTDFYTKSIVLLFSCVCVPGFDWLFIDFRLSFFSLQLSATRNSSLRTKQKETPPIQVEEKPKGSMKRNMIKTDNSHLLKLSSIQWRQFW